MRPIIAIVPYEPIHRAMLPVRPEQRQELERFGEGAGTAAELGPAFSAVEQDAEGRITAVLACAGLAEKSRDYAIAWAAFADGLRAAQWSPITRAIRGVLDGADYKRIDILVRNDWPSAQRFADALGFVPEFTVYTRQGGEA